MATSLNSLHRTLRKRLTTRELARLAGRLAAATPGVGSALGLAVEGATYAEAATRVLSVTDYDEPFAIDAVNARFLDVYRDALGPLWKDGVLHVAARIGVYGIADGEIRMASGVLRRRGDGRLLTTDRVEDRLRAQRPTWHRRHRHIAGSVLPLAGSPTGRGNYYHMLCERFRLVLHAVAKVPELRRATLVVREDVPGYHRAFQDMLRAAYPELAIEAVGTDVLVTCDELVVAQREDAHEVGHFAGREDFRALRAGYRSIYGIADTPPSRHIYLSRAGVKKRHILNEDAVLEALAPWNFEVVAPETMSHRDQVAIFGEAALIVGPSGAAFTNLVFATPGAKVVEICAPDIQEAHFIAGALQAGLAFRHVFGEPTKLYECFEVDPAAVRTAVEG